MNKLEILVINGPPGSGKTTTANEISEQLREKEVPHAILDVDELARIYPETNDSDVKWEAVRLLWPNYQKLTPLKVILPVLLDTKEDVDKLKAATPCHDFIICELVANKDLLKQRIKEREPNEFWQRKISKLVDRYDALPNEQRFGDFQVHTDNQTALEAASEILIRLGWN